MALTPSKSRSVASFALGLSALAAAQLAGGGCGGGRSDYLNDGGGDTGSSSGGSSGGSSGSSSGTSASSSGVTGSSSGISGSSSGITGSSSSSGGSVCTPLPGCMSTSVCPAGDGCNTCYCAFDGSWQCTTVACVEAGMTCPPTEPSGACSSPGEMCGYPNGACGDQCYCKGGQWQCFAAPCPPPPTCPTNEPPNGMTCGPVGTTCDYPIKDPNCSYDQCECDQSGTWGCTMAGCNVDAGVGD